MDRIWNEISGIRAQQAEDFKVMMMGFQSQKDSTEALQKSVEALHKSQQRQQESFGQYMKSTNTRFDLLEEALRILESRAKGIEQSS